MVSTIKFGQTTFFCLSYFITTVTRVTSVSRQNLNSWGKALLLLQGTKEGRKKSSIQVVESVHQPPVGNLLSTQQDLKNILQKSSYLFLENNLQKCQHYTFTTQKI